MRTHPVCRSPPRSDSRGVAVTSAVRSAVGGALPGPSAEPVHARTHARGALPHRETQHETFPVLFLSLLKSATHIVVDYEMKLTNTTLRKAFSLTESRTRKKTSHRGPGWPPPAPLSTPSPSGMPKKYGGRRPPPPKSIPRDRADDDAHQITACLRTPPDPRGGPCLQRAWVVAGCCSFHVPHPYAHRASPGERAQVRADIHRQPAPRPTRPRRRIGLLRGGHDAGRRHQHVGLGRGQVGAQLHRQLSPAPDPTPPGDTSVLPLGEGRPERPPTNHRAGTWTPRRHRRLRCCRCPPLPPPPPRQPPSAGAVSINPPAAAATGACPAHWPSAKPMPCQQPLPMC